MFFPYLLNILYHVVAAMSIHIGNFLNLFLVQTPSDELGIIYIKINNLEGNRMKSEKVSMSIHITFKQEEAPLYYELMKKSSPGAFLKDLYKEELECTNTLKNMVTQFQKILEAYIYQNYQ